VSQALGGAWEAALSEVAVGFEGADLAFANLESLLTTAPQVAGRYDLRAPPRAVVALQAAGFDALSLANNHALDAGVEGLAQTREVLAGAGIRAMGNGESVCAPGWCVVAFSGPPQDASELLEAVAALNGPRRFMIVSLHWGAEYQAAPSPAQRTLAEQLSAAGADLIVGHGPHVLQPAEWVGETLVVYSLGNLLFDQPYPADCRRGAILHVRVRNGRIAAVEVVPTVVEGHRVRRAGAEDAGAVFDRLGPAFSATRDDLAISQR
jgi:poly-gamma-glutamate capsule biosynthesis protein CapA/YwtB (metallophosphatase superfamily)